MKFEILSRANVISREAAESPSSSMLNRSSKFRSGLLRFESIGSADSFQYECETPLYLVYTRKGAVPNIPSMDILDEILSASSPSNPVQLSFWDLYEQGGVQVQRSFADHCRAESEKEQQAFTPLQRFLQLKSSPLFVTIRDPLFSANLAFAADKQISYEASSGRCKVSFESFEARGNDTKEWEGREGEGEKTAIRKI